MRISMRWLFLKQDHARTALVSWISALSAPLLRFRKFNKPTAEIPC